jgi:hypothetical protein
MSIARPQARRSLPLVDPRDEDEVSGGQAAKVKIELLEPNGGPVMPTLPVEDALGSPRVEDAKASGRSQRSQPTNGAVMDDTRAGKDDHIALSRDGGESVIFEPTVEGGRALDRTDSRRFGEVNFELELDAAAL